MRYNIFYRMHKAARALLLETGLDLQRTDFNSQEEARSMVDKLTLVDEFLSRQRQNEDRTVLTALRVYEPSVVDAFEQEHRKQQELCGKLRTLANIYSTLVHEAERLQLASALRRAFNELLAFSLVHMGTEEETLNTLLWRYYADDDMMAMETDNMVAQSPNVKALTWKWMLRGLSNPEIVRLLRAVENNSPEIDFNNLISLAEKELSNLRFRQVLEGLTEGQMMA